MPFASRSRSGIHDADRGRRAEFRPARSSLVVDEAVEGIEEGVDDRLAESVRDIGELRFVTGPGSRGECRALFTDDGIGRAR